MPRREPPREAGCRGTAPMAMQMAGASAATNANDDRPQIVSPLRAVTYTTRLSQPVPISLRAEGGAGQQFWFSNEALLGEVKAGESLDWSPPRAGRYTLRVVDEAGRTDSRDLAVEVVP